MLRPTALLVTCLVLAACSEAAPAEPDEAAPPRRVLLAGDSLTAGYYATDHEHGYADLLLEALRGRYDVASEVVAVPGARAFRVAAQVEDVTAGSPPVDVAVLEVGGNDVGKSTLGEWRAGYRRLLRAVAATSPDAEVVCLGPWNAPRASRRYEAVVRRLCRDHTYVRISDLYATDGLRGPAGTATDLGPSDDFHPNDRGHAAVAERVRAALN